MNKIESDTYSHFLYKNFFDDVKSFFDKKSDFFDDFGKIVLN